MCIWRTLTKGWLAVLLAAAVSGWAADEFRFELAGVRSGFSVNRGTRSDFKQFEGFAHWRLPWCWDMGRQWSLHTRLEASAGVLTAEDESGFIGTFGPALFVGRERLPVVFAAGISPTILSRDNFGNWDFGIPFQFTAYGGLTFELGRHFDLGYRFQHMSNAHLSDQNPGMNLHMFSLGYRF